MSEMVSLISLNHKKKFPGELERVHIQNNIESIYFASIRELTTQANLFFSLIPSPYL